MSKLTLLASAALLVAMSGAAGAGGYTAPVVEPVVLAPVVTAHDWSGPYAGLLVGHTSGTWELGTSTTGDMEPGNTYGAFVGYNLQNGNLVYGGELVLSQTHALPDLLNPANANMNTVVGIKGRLGYAMDRFMIYGTLGYGMGSVSFNGNDYDRRGLTYGIGAEFMVTSRVFVGLEYERAALEGPTPGPDAVYNFDTIALRVGFQF